MTSYAHLHIYPAPLGVVNGSTLATSRAVGRNWLRDALVRRLSSWTSDRLLGDVLRAILTAETPGEGKEVPRLKRWCTYLACARLAWIIRPRITVEFAPPQHDICNRTPRTGDHYAGSRMA